MLSSWTSPKFCCLVMGYKWFLWKRVKHSKQIFLDKNSHIYTSTIYILLVSGLVNKLKKKFNKTLWKKVKLLKMSNFTFFHNVFYAISILKSFNRHITVVVCSFFEFGLVSKWCINPFPNKPWFLRVCIKSLLKTLWEKEKLLVTSNFSFSHSVFYPFGELSAMFIKFNAFVCRLFQFGRVQSLSFGKGLRNGLIWSFSLKHIFLVPPK